MLELKNTKPKRRASIKEQIEAQRAKEKKAMQDAARTQLDLAAIQKTLKELQDKADTRSKIVLGGALLKGISEGKIPAAVGRAVIACAAERDRALFDGFEFKVPETGTRPDNQRE